MLLTRLRKMPDWLTSYKTQTYKEMLKVGERWEEKVVEKLKELGFEAGRWQQNLPMFSEYDVRFSKFQRDIWVKAASGRKLNVEVKSRNSPFKYDTTDVGKVSTWNAKRYKVCLLIVVDQNTGEMKFTGANKDNIKKYWFPRNNNDRCYSIPRRFLFAFSGIQKVINGL